MKTSSRADRRRRSSSLGGSMLLNMLLAAATLLYSLILYAYVYRVVLPEGTGKVAFAGSFVNYFLMAAMLGIPTYGIRACAKVRDNKRELSLCVKELLTLNLISGLISFSVFAAAVLLIPRFSKEAALFFISGLSIPLHVLSADWFYKGTEQYPLLVRRSLLFKGAALLLVFLFVHGPEDYLIYAAVTVVGSIGYALWNYLDLKHQIDPLPEVRPDLRKHLRPLMAFFSMVIAVSIYTNIDTTMLGLLQDAEAVAYYDVAVKTKLILVNLITSVSAVLLPRASYYIEKKMKGEFLQISANGLECAAALSIPLAVLFVLNAGETVLLLAGDAYAASVLPMRFITPSIVFIAFSNIAGIQMLIPLGKEKAVLFSELAGALTDILLNLLLIPGMGAAGAALGTLAAEAVVLLIQAVFLKNSLPSLLQRLELHKILPAVLAGTAVLLLFRRFTAFGNALYLFLSCGLYLLVYCAVLLLMGERTASGLKEAVRQRVSAFYRSRHT